MSLVKLNAAIQRAISKRTWRSAYQSVGQSSTTNAPFPIFYRVVQEIFTAAHIEAMLDETGVGGVAIGSSTSKVDSYSVVNITAKHSFRNLALNPVFLDVWILTPTRIQSYKITTAATYDTLSEILMQDLYTGFQAHYLAADITAGLRTADPAVTFTGTGTEMWTSSDIFTPSTSRDFNKHWRIVKKHSVMLNPGQSLVFVDKPKDVKRFHADFDNDAFTLGRAGTARVYLTRQRGASGITAAGNFGYCTTQVVHEAQYRAKVFKENKDTYLTAVGAAASLPATLTAVSGVGDDAVVA